MSDDTGGTFAAAPNPSVHNVSRRRRGAILRALRRWEEWYGDEQALSGAVKEAERTGDVRVPLRPPRRLELHEKDDVSLPQREVEKFSAGFFKVVLRFSVWMLAAIRFGLGNLGDRILRRSSEERRAIRLRETMQRAGATFIKLGQQLSVRMDLVPYTYARELEKLLDAVPPFPAEEAIAEIERSTGRKIGEIFAAFDPVPIGSASVACVYQGVLRDGTHVAVKVRRPHIGEELTADMLALVWLLRGLELVWLSPGFTKHFTYELSTMLLEELDFVQEARLTDLFRKRARKAKLSYVSAPRVHFKYSGRSVLVADFVGGVWTTDLLRAVEENDVATLQKLRENGIDPKRVARHYMHANRFGGFENIFFHADLHPANVVIQENSNLVLIDFGACGAFSRRERTSWRRLLDAQEHEDITGMVQAAIALLEPLPAIDIDEFQTRLEAVFWKDLYAIKSKHSPWWEHTSANIWISFLKLAREFDIPMNLNTLRMIRASMLADTVAARLDHDIDPYAEYRRYERGAGRRARKRLRKRLRRESGPRLFSRLEQGVEAASAAIYKVQRFIDGKPLLDFVSEIAKAAFGFKLLMDLSSGLAGATLALVMGIAAWDYLRGHARAPLLIFGDVIHNGWYQAAVVIGVLLVGRRLHHRLRRPEIQSERRTL